MNQDEMVSIAISTLMEKDFVALNVPLSTTVADIKHKIQNTHVQQPSPKAQRLIYCGKICSDESTLEQLLKRMDLNAVQKFHVVIQGVKSTSSKLPQANVPSPPVSLATEATPTANITAWNAMALGSEETSNQDSLDHDNTPSSAHVPSPVAADESNSAPMPQGMPGMNPSQTVPPAVMSDTQMQQYLMQQQIAMMQMRLQMQTYQQQMYMYHQQMQQVHSNLSNGRANHAAQSVQAAPQQAQNGAPVPAGGVQRNAAGLWAALNLKLALRILLVVSILCQDASTEKFLIISASAGLVYLYIVGFFSGVISVVSNMMRQRVNPVGEPMQQPDQQEAAPPVSSAGYVPIATGGGLLVDIRYVIVGFLLSLLPSWRPLSPDAAPRANVAVQ